MAANRLPIVLANGLPMCSEAACGQYTLRGTCKEIGTAPRGQFCVPMLSEIVTLGKRGCEEAYQQAQRVRELEQGARVVAAALEALADGADHIDRTAIVPQDLGPLVRARAVELRALATRKGGAS